MRENAVLKARQEHSTILESFGRVDGAHSNSIRRSCRDNSLKYLRCEVFFEDLKESTRWVVKALSVAGIRDLGQTKETSQHIFTGCSTWGQLRVSE